MTINKNWPIFVFATWGVMGCVGCNGKSNSAASQAFTHVSNHYAGDGHDHMDNGHSEHAHPVEGPHHGHLIELGREEYHAELTHDDVTQTVSVFLLDANAKSFVPIADSEIALNLVVSGVPRQFKLAAMPQEGDPAGHASRFLVVDEKLLESLEAATTTAQLNIAISGKTYTGKFDHHGHGEHTH